MASPRRVEMLVRPDPAKPARLFFDHESRALYLEYTGVDNNVYRVPITLFSLPKEFSDLAPLLDFSLLPALSPLGNFKVGLHEAGIIQPVEVQSNYKEAFVVWSGTATASGSTTDIDVERFRALEVELKVTAVSGTAPTLSVYVEGRFETTGDYKVLASQEGITGTGIWFLTMDPMRFRRMRVRWVVGGTSPSFTFRVDAVGVA